MKVNLVLILAMIGCVRGQMTLGERRRGTVEKICRTFCPDCSPSTIGATSSSEATEYCRRNPTALSCELARRDPERAIRVFQNNQWAFIRGGPSNEEEAVENEYYERERTTTTVGREGQGSIVSGSFNQPGGGDSSSTVFTGANTQGGRPTGNRNGGTLEEVTANRGGGSSGVVITGGGSQGVALTGGGSGGRVITGGGSGGLTGGGSGGRVLTGGGSGGLTGGGSGGRVITGGGSGGLTGGGSGGRVLTGGGSGGRVITGGGSRGTILTGGGSGGRVLSGGGSGGRVTAGGGSGGSVLTGGGSGGRVLTGGGPGGRVLIGGGSEGRVTSGGRVVSTPVFSAFVEGNPQVERVTGNMEERVTVINAPEVERSSQNAPYNGGDVEEGREDGRSFYVTGDGGQHSGVAGGWGYHRGGAGSAGLGPDQSHAGRSRHARQVAWMDVCRSQGTLVTPSRVYLNDAWTDIELYSLQVGRSVFQRFYAVKCVENTPTANCQGECRDKRSQFPALEIYKDSNGDLQVRPRLVDVTTCCQLVIST